MARQEDKPSESMSVLTKFDMFAVPVSLTHLNCNFHQSIWGAVTTLIIVFLSLIYMILVFIEPLATSDGTSSSSSKGFEISQEIGDFYYSEEVHKPLKAGFQIGFNWNRNYNS